MLHLIPEMSQQGRDRGPREVDKKDGALQTAPTLETQAEQCGPVI